jgi:hypothetical protein
MTAQVATTTHNNPPADPDTARAHAITMATLVTEAAVVIGTTDVRPGAITVREFSAAPHRGTSRSRRHPGRHVDEVGRVFALPVIDYAAQLHTRAWDGVSLAGHLVTVRVYSGRRA